MKRSILNKWRDLLLLLTIVIALSSIDLVESSKLKRARKSIENSEESETNKKKWSPRRRLTMADDVFTGTSREFEVVGFHRAIGAIVKKIFGTFFGGIGSVINFIQFQFRSAINAILHSFIRLLQSIQNAVAIEESEPEPEPTTMSSIYNSISSVMSSSIDSEPTSKEKPSVKRQQIPDTKAKTTSTPTNKVGQKATTNKAAPLLNKKNLSQANTRGALGKKSIMEDLVKGGSSSSSVFDSTDSATTSSEVGAIAVPSTSRLAQLLPTLVAGLVFTTAGSIVGFLWSTEWSKTASSYADYFWGEGEGNSENSSFLDTATDSYADGHDDMSDFSGNPTTRSSSSAIPVTPDKF